MKIIGITLLIVFAYGLGMWNGWSEGVRDGHNLETVTTP